MAEPVQESPSTSQADLQMHLKKIKANVILRGPIFPEPVEVLISNLSTVLLRSPAEA